MGSVLQPVLRMVSAHSENRFLFGINHLIFTSFPETGSMPPLPEIAFQNLLKLMYLILGVRFIDHLTRV